MDKCLKCGEEMQSFMTHKCKPDLFKDFVPCHCWEGYKCDNCSPKTSKRSEVDNG